MLLRYIIVALLCPCFSLFAQKPLSIGDTVPDIEFRQLLHHSSPTARLSDFNGKLVILDFWATWCTSCLHAFPKLDTLQSAFKDELKIILVNSKNTGDDLSRVQAFLSRWKTRTGKKLELTTAVNDTIADNLFPHKLIPHYVWIGKSGRMIATTSSAEVNASTIRHVLDGVPTAFTMKKDQHTDQPIFSSADLPISNLVNYAILVKGSYDGLPTGSRVRQKDGIIYGTAITNTSLLDLYKAIARKAYPSFSNKQLIVVTNDSSDLFAPPPGTDAQKNWYNDHAYTIDVIVPLKMPVGFIRRCWPCSISTQATQAILN